MRVRSTFMLVLGICALPASAPASTPAADPTATADAPAARHAPVVTRHTGTFNGKRIAYTATVGSTDVPAPDGKGGARVVSIAYTADAKPAAAARRPVIFLFNGGPIAASYLVHIGGFGPRRLALPADLAADPAQARMVDNADSPLDVADLVFVDPATTGYSRTLPGTTPGIYASNVGDGQQIAGFVARWLADHGRLDAPVYLFGESYGTMRAAEVAKQLAAMPRPVMTSGVLMLGQALNIIEISQRPANIVSYVVSLPTLAVTAWYHDRIDRKGRDLDALVAEATAFARTDYLAALVQGSRLPDAERQRVAGRLAALTGIPARYYLDHDLRITKESFRGELLADRKLLLGRNDSRYTAPITKDGVGPDPFDVVMPALEAGMNRYLRDELKVDWPDRYVPYSFQDFAIWDWGWTSPFTSYAYPDALTAMWRANPRFKLFVGNGYYDTQTSIGAAAYLVDQAGWPADRVTLRYYTGGHAAYTDDGAARAIGQDVRAFVNPEAEVKP